MESKSGRDEIFEAITALNRLWTSYGERKRKLAALADLTELQWELLEKIADKDFVPSQFAKNSYAAPAGISRALRQLREKGLVDYNMSEQDGRRRQYTLTRKGATVNTEILRGNERAIKGIWSQFKAANLVTFTRFSNELCEKLNSYSDRKV